METGDGLLVRLHPFGGRIQSDQARMIAQAAREHGNGLLDITARGNLQIRGVSESTYPNLLMRLDEEGLVEPERDGPSRLTVVCPLAGVDPREHLDALALAQSIESKAGGVEGLPAKFFVAIDGGGSMPLDGIGADLHLVAMGKDELAAVAFAFATPDGLSCVGATSIARAPEASFSIIAGFAAMRRAGRTEARRLRDLDVELAQELVRQVALKPVTTLFKQPSALQAGLIDLGAEHAILLALPFGRCSADQLAQAAGWSERFGRGEIRLSFTRGILLPVLSGEDAALVLNEARRSGFIVSPDDPRLSLIACPGRPACGGAMTSAPDDALRIAGAAEGLLAQGVTLHVSGCPKGCAHPGKADLTLMGRNDGSYDAVLGGSTRDAAFLHLSVDEIMTRLLPVKTLSDLHRAFQENAR
jgi:precorrin-3B synthase